jgi:hypothetical protein
MKKPLFTRDGFFTGVVEDWSTGVMDYPKK